MIKLVILSESMAGQSHELKVEKTTIGRVEDNTFPIAEPSVSSHHCDVFLRDAGVVVRDLQSTNGTYINGNASPKHHCCRAGARLGQVELRLETDATQAAAKKTTGPTVAMQRGVSLNELESGVKSGSFDMTRKGFSKKEDKTGKIFWVAAVVVGAVILLLLVYVFSQIK